MQCTHGFLVCGKFTLLAQDHGEGIARRLKSIMAEKLGNVDVSAVTISVRYRFNKKTPSFLQGTRTPLLAFFFPGM